MQEIKISLNIKLPGSILLSEQECSKNPKNFDLIQLKVPKIKGFEILNVKTRKSRTAEQVINMTKDAYYYMISNNCPSWVNPKKWNSMNKKQRLESHLKRTMEHLGGISFNYVVFED